MQVALEYHLNGNPEKLNPQTRIFDTDGRITLRRSATQTPSPVPQDLYTAESTEQIGRSTSAAFASGSWCTEGAFGESTLPTGWGCALGSLASGVVADGFERRLNQLPMLIAALDPDFVKVQECRRHGKHRQKETCPPPAKKCRIIEATLEN